MRGRAGATVSSWFFDRRGAGEPPAKMQDCRGVYLRDDPGFHDAKG
jgi:hypothetical protein